MRGAHVCALNLADTSVSGEDDDGRQVALKSSVHISEALDIEHVHLINEEDTWNELRDTVINIAVHNLINFETQLLCDLSLLRSVNLGHKTKEVVATLGPGICYIEIVKSHILNNLLSLMDVALGHWNVLFGFQIILSRIRIRSANTLHSTACCLDIDDIAHGNLFLLDVLVDARIKLKLLLTLCGLKADNDCGDLISVPTVRIFRLLRRDLSDFTFPDFFCLLDSQSDSSTEVFHQDLSLFNLGGVDLGTDHGAEGHLGSELGGNSQGKSGLTRSWGTSEEKSLAGHLLALDHINDDSSGLSGLLLSDKAGLHLKGGACFVESQSLDVSMRGDSLRASSRSYFFNLHLVFFFSF